MHSRRRALALAAPAALAAAMMVPAGALAASTHLEANLSGNKEVPDDSGDPNGRGTADIILRKDEEKVCFAIDTRHIGAPTAAHIHRGVPGEDGPIRVTLFDDPANTSDDIGGCVDDVRQRQIRRIRDRPGKFYVNVHNMAFPDGAIRGQLRRP